MIQSQSTLHPLPADRPHPADPTPEQTPARAALPRWVHMLLGAPSPSERPPLPESTLPDEHRTLQRGPACRCGMQ